MLGSLFNKVAGLRLAKLLATDLFKYVGHFLVAPCIKWINWAYIGRSDNTLDVVVVFSSRPISKRCLLHFLKKNLGWRTIVNDKLNYIIPPRTNWNTKISKFVKNRFYHCLWRVVLIKGMSLSDMMQ